MWKRLQPQLFLHVLRHPHFLRWLPDQLISFIRERWSRRHTRELSEVDVEIQEEP